MDRNNAETYRLSDRREKKEENFCAYQESNSDSLMVESIAFRHID
jgi:hypothetical protein